MKDILRNFDKDKSIYIGSGIYKVRVVGFGKGKSGGYRADVFIMEIEGIWVAIFIYLKMKNKILVLGS